MKRRREDVENQTDDDVEPLTSSAVVELHYKYLPPDSRKQLDACLQDWARWHYERYLPVILENQATARYNFRHLCILNSSDRAITNLGYRPPEVISGSVSYQPDLMQLGDDIFAWEDKPNPPSKVPSGTMWFNISYEKTSSVPAYDRAVETPLRCPDPKKRGSAAKSAAHELSLSAEGGGTKADEAGAAGRPAKRPRPATTPNRCFNCGSYSHSLRECWKEFNTQLVEQSKREYEDAKGTGSGYRSAAKRYFLAGAQGGGGGKGQGRRPTLTLAEEFEDVVPGRLSKELREAMGIGAVDPPPWLHRMRAMGLPPGYQGKEQAGGGGEQPGAGMAASAITPQGPKGVGSGCGTPVPAPQASIHWQNGLAARPQKPHVPPALASEPSEGLNGRDGGRGGSSGAPGGVCMRGASEGCSVESGEIAGTEVQGSDRSAALRQAGEGPAADPAEDFIPFETAPVGEGGGMEGADAEAEQQEEGGTGAPPGVALFPGVNAPLPEGADPAQWTPQFADAPALGFAPGNAGRQHRQPAQRMRGTPLQGSGSASRLGRLSGGHPSFPEATDPCQPGPSPVGYVTPSSHPRYPSPSHQHRHAGQHHALRHMPSAPALLQATPSIDPGPGSGGGGHHGNQLHLNWGNHTSTPHYHNPAPQGQAQFAAHAAPHPEASPGLLAPIQQDQPIIYTLSNSGAGQVLTPASLPLLAVQQQAQHAQQQPQHAFATHLPAQVHAGGEYSQMPPHHHTAPAFPQQHNQQQHFVYAGPAAQQLLVPQQQPQPQHMGAVQAAVEGYPPLVMPAGGTGQLQGSYPILAPHLSAPAYHHPQPSPHQGW